MVGRVGNELASWIAFYLTMSLIGESQVIVTESIVLQ